MHVHLLKTLNVSSVDHSTASGRRLEHTPFWGLNLSFQKGARVLVLEDRVEERLAIFERLLQDCEMTFATSPDEAYAIMQQQTPFDAYCIDYNLVEKPGGWLPVAQAIRKWDPYSIAKIVLIHSSNLEARKEYLPLFPAAIAIQWDVLATILGADVIDRGLITQVVKAVDAGTSLDEMRNVVMQARSDRS